MDFGLGFGSFCFKTFASGYMVLGIKETCLGLNELAAEYRTNVGLGWA